jgi:ribonuclease VapC
MIIDTSALIAILRGEPEAKHCALAIEKSANRRLSAANFVETALVIDGSRDPIASRRFDDLVNESRIVIEPVTEAQARIAREAYRDFGRGSGHPAKLNLGDCFACALSKVTGISALQGRRLHPHRHRSSAWMTLALRYLPLGLLRFIKRK